MRVTTRIVAAILVSVAIPITMHACGLVDLRLTKDATVDVVSPGDVITYKIAVLQQASGTATSVSFQDGYDSRLTYQTFRGTGILGPATSCSNDNVNKIVTCTLSSFISSGFTWTFELDFQFNVDPEDPTCDLDIVNNATVTSREGDQNASDDSAQETIRVQDCGVPDIEVIKEAIGSGFQQGDSISYRIVVSNPGTATAEDVVVFDDYEPGLIPTDLDRCSNIGGNQLRCELGDIAPTDNPISIELDFDIPETLSCPGILTNHAIVESTNVNRKTSTVENNFTCPQPNLVVTKIARPNTEPNPPVPGSPTVYYGQNITYDIVVHNDNSIPNVGPATGVEIVDTYQEGLTVQSATGCTDIGNRQLQCDVGTLAPGNMATFTITLGTPTTSTPCFSATVDNIAEVYSNESPVIQDREQVMIECPPDPPDLRVTKTSREFQVAPGQTITYDIVLTNHGGQAARNVRITDMIPTNTEPISIPGGLCNLQGGSIDCGPFDVPPNINDPLVLTFVFQTDPTTPCTQGTYVNEADITHDNGPLIEVTDTTPIHCPNGCIQITKEAFDFNNNAITTVPQFEFQLDAGETVFNDANGIARFFNVVPGIHSVSEIVPDGWDLVQVTPANGEIEVLPGTQCAGMVFKNVQHTPPPAPDLIVTKEGPTEVRPGDTDLEYTISVLNQGPGIANDVVVFDEFDFGMTPTSHPGCVQDDLNIRELRCPAGGLNVGESRSFTITFSIDAHLQCGQGQTITNVARARDGGNEGSTFITADVLCPEPPEANLTLTKLGQQFSAPDGLIEYTLIVTNNGPDDAIDVLLRDFLSLQSGFTLESTTSDECEDKGSFIECDDFNVIAGTSHVLNIHIRLDNDTALCDLTLDNNAQVTSLIPDSDTTDNHAQFSTLIECPQCSNGRDDDGDGAVDYLEDFSCMDDPDNDDERFPEPECDDGENNDTEDNDIDHPDDMGCANNQDDDETDTPKVADLEIDKLELPEIRLGETVTYILMVTNHGPDVADMVTVTDFLSLPRSMTFQQTQSPGCETDGDTIKCMINNLAVGVPTPVRVAFTLDNDPNLCTTPASQIRNFGEVAGWEVDPDSSNNSDNIVTTIVCDPVTPPDPTLGCIDVIKETFDPNNSLITPVTQFTFHLDGDTSNPQVNDSLGLARFTNVTPGVHTITEVIPTGWEQFQVTPAGGQVTVAAGSTCSAVNFKNRQIVAQAPDLTISKTDSQVSTTPGDTLNYEITITNSSNQAATNLEIIDTLPGFAGFSFADNGGVHDGFGSVTWSNITVGANSSRILRVDATVAPNAPNGATLTNRVEITQPNLSAFDDTTVVIPEANLTSTKTDNRTFALRNDTLNYKIEITNSSPFNATNVSVVDTLPPDPTLFTFISANFSGQYNGTTGITWTGLTVPANDSIILEANIRIAPGVPIGTDLVNSAQVNGGAIASDTTTVISTAPTLRIEKDDFRQTASEGDTLNYEITIHNDSVLDETNLTIIDTLPPDTFVEFISADNNGMYDPVADEVMWQNILVSANSSRTLRLNVRVLPTAPDGALIFNEVEIDGTNVDADDTTSVVGPPPSQTGCIDVLKEALDPQDNPLPVVPAFTFQRDGGVQNVVNDSLGFARFENVPVGSHTITELPLSGFELIQVTPANGQVTVTAGTACTGIIFKNRQVILSPTFTISKTDNLSTVAPGTRVTYQIDVTNTSTVNAPAETIVDDLPDNVTFVAASDNGSFNSTTREVTWTNIEILAGQTRPLILTVDVDASAPDGFVLENEAEIRGQTAQDLTTVQVVTPVAGCIQITKEAVDSNNVPLPVIPAFTFQLDGGVQTTQNDSLGLARFNNVPVGSHVVSEVLLSGFDLIQTTPLGGVVTVAAGNQCSTVTFRNREQGTTPDPTFTIAKTDNQTTVTPGTRLTYEISITNTSAVNALNETVTDILPPNLDLASITISDGGVLNTATRTVTWTGIAVPAGQTRVPLTIAINVNAAAPNGTVLTNTANIRNVTGQDITTITTAPEPTFAISKTDNVSTIAPGTQNHQYIINVINTSVVNATSETVVDTLPDNVTFVAASDGGTFNAITREVTWTNLAILAGQTRPLVLTVNIDAGTPDGFVLDNEVEIRTETANDLTTVQVVAPQTGCIDVLKEALDVAGNPLPVIPQFTFTLDGGVQTTQNDSQGLARFNNVPVGSHTVTETLLPGFDLIQTTPPGGVVNVVAGTQCAGVIFKNQQTLAPQPTFVITKTDNQTTVAPGTQLTYQIVATNTSAVNAPTETVIDTLPGNVTFVSADNGGVFNAGNGTVTWSNLAVNPGAPVTLTLVVTVNANAPDGFVLDNDVTIRTASAEDLTTVQVTPPQTGCIDVTKIALDLNQNPLAVVPPFTFQLDGGPTVVQNNATGIAQFTNVPVGQHTITELPLTGFQQTTVVPAGGIVTVAAGSQCADVTFTNQQVITAPSFSIAKTDNQSFVTPGTRLNYEISVTNTSTMNAPTETIVDTLPANLTFVAASDNGSFNATTREITWTNIAILPGQTRTLTIMADVDAGTANNTVLTNTATIRSETATDLTTVTATPPQTGCIIVLKEALDFNANPLPIIPPFTFTLDGGSQTVVNDALGLAMFQDVPVGQHTVTETPMTGFQLLQTTPAGGVVTVPAGNQCVGVIFKNQQVQDPTFTIAKTDNQTTVAPGTRLTYDITITNTSLVNGTNETIVDTLPANVTFVSATDGGSHNSPTGEVTWTNISIPAGQHRTISVTVDVSTTAPDGFVLENSAVIRNVTATDQTTVDVTTPVFTITKTDGLATTTPGSTITYTIIVTNTTAVAAPDQVITDVLPTSLTFLSASAGGSFDAALRTVTWNNQDFTANEVKTFTIQAQVDASADDGMVLTNTASVTGGPSATDTTIVNVNQLACGNLTINLTESRDPVEPDETFTYTITVRNSDSQTVGPFTVTQSLDSRTSFRSATEGGTESSNTVRWNNITLTTNETKTLTSTVRVSGSSRDGDSLFSNAFACSASDSEQTLVRDQFTPNPPRRRTNTRFNTHTRIDRFVRPERPPVARPATLVVDKRADRPEAQPGSLVTYTITLRNPGSTPMPALEVVDRFNASQMTIEDTGNGKSGNGTLTWSLPGLQSGESRTIRYRARLSSALRHGQSVSNTVTVNGATDTVTVNIIEFLPQTGIGGTYLKKLTDDGAGLTTAIVESDSSTVELTIWISIIALGLAAGTVLGKKAF